MWIAEDTHWAPGGDRSRTGVVILVLGAMVHWMSQKQSGTALAVHEAELNGAVTGTMVGILVRNIVEELCDMPSTLKLDQDTKATITTRLHGVTYWRSRHYAMRVAAS